MRRILILCLMMLFIVVSTLSVSANSNKPEFSIQLPTELPKAGETFEVSVEISNNPGFCVVQYSLIYDKSLMKCNDAIVGDMLEGSLSATNVDDKDGVIIAAASLNTISEDGVISLYSFTANQDISDYGFKLANITIADENRNDIEYKFDENIMIGSSPTVPDNTVESKPSTGGSGGGTSSKPSGSKEDSSVNQETVTEEKEEVFETVFPDVVGHWAEPYVNKAVDKGLFLGGSDGNFNPDDNVTRAQFVTVLWRMAGRPAVNIELPFVDVKTLSDEFKNAIAWGYANGYINGTSDITFDPGASLTREAGMKILYFYSGEKPGGEFQLYGIYDGTFKDSDKISQWAKQSLYWGVYNKLLSGVSETELAPQGTATRAQLAKILVNYLDEK